MRIPTETLTKWDGLREKGDIDALVKLTGLSRATIYNLFRHGETTTKIAGKLEKFFTDREATIKRFNPQDQD